MTTPTATEIMLVDLVKHNPAILAVMHPETAAATVIAASKIYDIKQTDGAHKAQQVKDFHERENRERETAKVMRDAYVSARRATVSKRYRIVPA